MKRAATCCPDKPHMALGFCKSCYFKQNYQKKRDEIRQKMIAYHKNNYARNRDRILSKQLRYRAENKDLIKAKQRENWTKYAWGISREEYQAKIDSQNGVCAICKRVPLPRRNRLGAAFCVDHNHKTNKLRGMLCDPCNIAIGLLDEDAVRLDIIKEYLAMWEIKHNEAG